MGYVMNRENKKRVLLSGAGGSGTIEIIKDLRKRKDYWVASVDSDPYAAGLYISDYGEKVCSVKSKEYFKRLKAIVKKHKINFYIPLIDEELLPAYEFAGKIANLTLILPKREFTALVLNKYKMVKEFTKCGIRCPKTYKIEELKRGEFKKKMFLKPIVGRGSRGIAIIRSRNELNNYFQNSPYRPSQVMIQEYIGGEEYTVSAVVGKSGFIYSIVPKRIIKKQGVTHRSITEKNALIEKTVENIQKHFEANGPFNVQLKIYNGKPYILEVNPRFSTTVVHTMAAGVNEVVCLIDDFIDAPLKKKRIPFEENLIMSRYFAQCYFKETERK